MVLSNSIVVDFPRLQNTLLKIYYELRHPLRMTDFSELTEVIIMWPDTATEHWQTLLVI